MDVPKTDLVPIANDIQILNRATHIHETDAGFRVFLNKLAEELDGGVVLELDSRNSSASESTRSIRFTWPETP